MFKKGIAASPGIAIGKVFLLDRDEITIPNRKISESDLPNEIMRFENALIKTRKEMLDIQSKIAEDMDTKHAEIFNAHLLVLEDRMLIEEVIRRLSKEKRCVEFVFFQALQKFSKAFSSIEDEYLRERAADIHDVGKRVIRNLLGKERRVLSEIREQCIVIAYDLAPSETVFLDKNVVLGFATDIGSRTSHAAIIARSLEIPAVVGLEDITHVVESGDTIALDGLHGVIEINPDKKSLERYESEKGKYRDFTVDLSKLQFLSATTTDQHISSLYANIEMSSDLSSALFHGAEGIGLYRTEYFYMKRTDLPTEEEHFQNYKLVAEKMHPRPVVIRTMDLGGDKFLSHLDIPHEMNPFMGWRAIRFCLEKVDIFKTQLRAIVRANYLGNLKVLFPLITNLTEVIKARAILREVIDSLQKEKVQTNYDIDVGIMIEVPSAAIIADILADHVDFFSIGTNDLLQYALAVDRVNEHIAYIYDPAHPAIIRLIQNVIDAAKAAKIKVSMCGEMASDPIFIPLLLGMGLVEFSVPSAFIPEVKKVTRSVSLAECQQLVSDIRPLTTGKTIETKLWEFLRLKVPDIHSYTIFNGGDSDST